MKMIAINPSRISLFLALLVLLTSMLVPLLQLLLLIYILLPIKLNCVVQRGVNEDSILGLARMWKGSGHIVRFIEYMDVGHTNGWRLDDVVPAAEIVEAIAAGEAVPMPVRFRVTMPDPPPNAQSIEYGHMWSRGPTETDVENIVDSWRRQRR